MTGETFGQMLKRLREGVGMSQNRLARETGIDPAYVNQMERSGQQTVSGLVLRTVIPSRGVMLGMAAALGLSAAATDRFLFVAGLAPQLDWQTRAVRAETALATIRQAFEDHAQADDDEQPTFIRSRTG